MNVKSVLVVSDSARIDGGAAKVAIDTAKAMARRGLDVEFFAGGTEADDELATEARVTLTGASALGDGRRTVGKAIRGIRNADARARFERVLARYSPASTVVHFHSWGSRLSPAVFSPARRAGFGTVITAHDYLLGCPNACRYKFPLQESCDIAPGSLRCVAENCDRASRAAKTVRLGRYVAQRSALDGLRPTVVYVSDFQRARVDHFLSFEHRSYVVSNPIEAPGASGSYQGEAGPFLFAGRLEAEKGADVFCEALATSGVPGAVVGDGTLRDDLSTRFPGIPFLGWRSAGELREDMLRSRALVFPSRWFEAAPLTPVEAQLAAALPCIVSDACAARDSVEDGVTGLHFRSGDSEDLARCLRTLSDPEVHLRMRRNIESRRGETTARHSLTAYVDNLLPIYDEAIAAGGSVAA
ncbi:glycosyltransferase family 4 protein [Cellulomonas uda]|uniref:Glycosyl transferase n=1 Tax=Cellulomonas uda TaxID=1714 RepID=A0A4Y3KGK6_CELUD|nr:glycosyltransferase family 4 protein [Cellulomonas uda]GEA82060.1 glycosyl transferase [Cellulomonas uda]